METLGAARRRHALRWVVSVAVVAMKCAVGVLLKLKAKGGEGMADEPDGERRRLTRRSPLPEHEQRDVDDERSRDLECSSPTIAADPDLLGAHPRVIREPEEERDGRPEQSHPGTRARPPFHLRSLTRLAAPDRWSLHRYPAAEVLECRSSKRWSDRRCAGAGGPDARALPARAHGGGGRGIARRDPALGRRAAHLTVVGANAHARMHKRCDCEREIRRR